MQLEFLNTIGTLITIAIVAATAIAAMVQLRHLRAGNQIAAVLAVQNELDSADFREAEVIVRRDLPLALMDRSFCEFEIAMALRKAVAPNADYLKVRQAGNLIGNTFENLGAMVKNGILDQRLFLDIYSWIVLGQWQALEGLTALARESTGEPSIFENFEYIAVISREYLKTHPITYPRGFPRMNLRLPQAAEGLVGTQANAKG